jgi:hypothetical protein
MKVSKVVLSVLVVTMLVGTGLIAGTAYAQDDDPPAGTPVVPERPFSGRGFGPHMADGMMLADGEHPLHDYILAAYAEAFGMSVSDLESKLEAGEMMMEIVLASGLSQEEAWDVMRDARQSALEAAQTDGIELPAFGPRGEATPQYGNGDCLMDGSGAGARGMFGRRGFAPGGAP